MQFNIMSHILFLFVMVIFFPYLIFAPWTEDNLPVPPPNGVKMYCAQWINYSGFTLDNYPKNREKAMSRDITKDRIVSTWAAMYAFKISGVRDIYRILPEAFCESFGNENLDPMKFQALEDEERNCEDWIKLYTFDKNHRENYIYAMNVDQERAKYISIWAYSYWKFIWQNNGRYTFSPFNFCHKIGKPVGHNTGFMPFKCVHGFFLTCIDWVGLYDYNDNITHNLRKARELISAKSYYPISIHYFPDKYAFKLVAKPHWNEPIDDFTPEAFCAPYNEHDAEPRRYDFDYGFTRQLGP